MFQWLDDHRYSMHRYLVERGMVEGEDSNLLVHDPDEGMAAPPPNSPTPSETHANADDVVPSTSRPPSDSLKTFMSKVSGNCEIHIKRYHKIILFLF